MNIGLYRKYLNLYVREAIENSDGSRSGISEYLGSIKVSGFLTRDKDEKKRAIQDAKNAFDDHRHWPLQIIVSHLGLEEDILNVNRS